jgi:hypothetical protein
MKAYTSFADAKVLLIVTGFDDGVRKSFFEKTVDGWRAIVRIQPSRR